MTATTTYTETVGRRKTAAARVRLTPAAKGSMTINNRDLANYFPVETLRLKVLAPIEQAGTQAYTVTAVVKGGGIAAQAEAIRHAISRALVERDAELRKTLKPLGFLKRDPRAKERRKFGLKKARKAAQWSKR